jgi:geranylgeranyl transferase type-1 subunit beta
MNPTDLVLTHGRHAKFFQRTLAVLPSSLSSFDTQRVTVAYFAISGLDLLDRLDMIETEKAGMVAWLYSCLISPTPGQDNVEEEVLSKCGFRGSPALKLSSNSLPSHSFDHGHIAMTYTALASLLVLGDDLSMLDRKAVIAGVRALQLPDGSYKAALEGGENDMRFLYCAAAICSMLGDWEGMDQEAATHYVLESISYEGGIGQGPGLEAHGGSTYCGVAALALMGRLGDLGRDRLDRVVRWCVFRQAQGSGFMGRPHKPEDTCYSFWVGATLSLLGKLEMCDKESSRQFVLSTQDPVTGGLAKWPDTQTDPLHTYLGLSGLGIQGEDGVLAVDPALNMSKRTKHWLEKLQQTW